MGTRTVTGTVYKPDGSAYNAASVVFTLIDPFETSTEYYPAVNHTETTDAAGQFSTALGVPDTGTAAYRVTLPDNKWYEFNLAAGAAVDLVTLIVATNPAVDPDAVQTLLDAYSKMTMRSITGTDSIVAADEYVDCDGTFALTLPLATGSGLPYIVDNIGAGVITVTRAGSDTIDGATTKDILAGNSATFLDRSAGFWRAIGV